MRRMPACLFLNISTTSIQALGTMSYPHRADQSQGIDDTIVQ